jgi:hypothetical protein
MNRDLTRLMIAVDQADTAPASSIIEAFGVMCGDTRGALERWNELRTSDVPRLNAMLVKESLPPLTVPETAPPAPNCAN